MSNAITYGNKSFWQNEAGQWFIWTNEGTLLNCWGWKETAAPFNGLTVGQAVITSGYPGTVTRLCEWSTSMVEVRLASGVVCLSASDVKPSPMVKHAAAGVAARSGAR